MQIIKCFIKLVVFICPLASFAQSTYLSQGATENHVIDRLEIKQQTNTNLNFSTLKPFNRKYIVREAEFLDSARMGYTDFAGEDKFKQRTDLDLSPVDEYNLRSLLMNNSEWVTTPHDYFLSKHPVLKTFYKTKANLYEVNTRDFFLSVNPVLQFNLSKESNNNERLFLNTRGVTIRGMIARKIGFSSTITDNQERGPSYFQQQVTTLRAVPGEGFYKPFKSAGGVDYFDGRGYFTFNAIKFIDFQFGYDKNFIGNGYRSLFLSDWGNSNLFLKINTKIWKLNYQNLFMELIPQFQKNGDSLLPRKYAVMHHLSMNVTRWLNVGLFESIILARRDHFDFEYINPIIFLRYLEGNVGSPDKAHVGFDFKANVAHHVQFYGQFLLDEFIGKEILKNNGFWANKYAYQLGAKYIDAFGVKNLDLQVELNRARPFTYSHNDSNTNYTHYNQPLADPLGANFQEYIGIVNYQPLPKLTIYARAIYYYKGLDSAGVNFGGNIFENYTTRSSDSGYTVGGGNKIKVLNVLLQVSYEVKQNLFIDASVQQRNYKYANVAGTNKNSMFTLGVRLNMVKRQYDY